MAILHHLGTLRLCLGVHLLATCLLLAFPRVGQDPVEQPPEASEWHALLVGCDEYPNLKKAFPARYENELRLLGPANDVRLMRETLIESLGVPEDHITTLVGGWEPVDRDRQPNRRNIQSQLRALEKRVSAGDRVVLYFSGHGSQQVDSDRPDRDSEPDGLDEVFLPADVKSQASTQGRIPNALADDELGKAAFKLQAKGAQVWMIFDCCHAATMVRGGARSRSLDPDLFGIDAVTRGALPPEATLLEGRTLGNIVAMYASQSDARAPELPMPLDQEGADAHGLFTWTLVDQLRRREESWTFRDLFGSIEEAYSEYSDTVESMPVAEGALNLTLATGLAESTVTRWALVAGKLGSPRRLPVTVRGPGGEPLPEGPERTALEEALAPYAERLEFADDPERAVRVTVDEGGIWIHPGGPGEADVLGLETSELLERLGGLDLVRAAETAVEDGWAQPLGDVKIQIDRRPARGGRSAPLAPGEELQVGDLVQIWLTKPEGPIYDVFVLGVDAALMVTPLYPDPGDSPRLVASASEPISLHDGTVVDPTLGLERLIVFAVPREAGDPETNLMLRGLDVVPRISLVEITTSRPASAPSAWPRRGLVELPIPLTRSEGAPADPWNIAVTHAALKRGRGGLDTLLLGDAEGPRYVFVGPSGQGDAQVLVEGRSFQAQAVFHFFPDHRVAFYDSRGDGLDLVLIDSDLDGVADVRRERSAGGDWRVRAPVVLPWLSQGHLSPWQGPGRAPDHFQSLVR